MQSQKSASQATFKVQNTGIVAQKPLSNRTGRQYYLPTGQDYSWSRYQKFTASKRSPAPIDYIKRQCFLPRVASNYMSRDALDGHHSLLHCNSEMMIMRRSCGDCHDCRENEAPNQCSS